MSDAPRLTEAEVAVTGRCNLDCAYCFYADEMNSREDRPLDFWKAAFAELARAGVRSVCLSGGEPFTRPDIIDLVDAVVAAGMRYSFLTNGTLVDKEIIKALSRPKRRVRLNGMQFSVDGPAANTHDILRGEGAFASMAGNLKRALDAQFDVGIRMTITRKNYGHIRETVEFLLGLGLKGVTFNECMPRGSAQAELDGLFLTREERLQAALELLELDKEHPGKLSAQAGPLWLAKALIEKRPGGGMLSGCGGVFNKVGVLHDGGCVACMLLPGEFVCRLGEGKLEEAWLEAPSLVKLRRRREIPLDTLEECRGCAHIGYCRGGCPGMAVAAGLSLNSPDPVGCFKKAFSEAEIEEIISWARANGRAA